MNPHLPIQWVPKKNNMTTPPSYYPYAVPTATLDLEAISSMVANTTTFTEGDVELIIRTFFDVIQEKLAEGYNINLAGICSMLARLKGNLGTDPLVSLQSDALHIEIQASVSFRDKIRNVCQFTRLPVSTKIPMLASFSVGEDIHDKVLLEGGVYSLKGSNLAFEPTSLDLGIFFTDSETEVETRISNYGHITDHLVYFAFPLPDGDSHEYKVKVVTKYTEGGSLREGHLTQSVRTQIAINEAGDYPKTIFRGMTSV